MKYASGPDVSLPENDGETTPLPHLTVDWACAGSTLGFEHA